MCPAINGETKPGGWGEVGFEEDEEVLKLCADSDRCC